MHAARDLVSGGTGGWSCEQCDVVQSGFCTWEEVLKHFERGALGFCGTSGQGIDGVEVTSGGNGIVEAWWRK